MTRSLKHHKLLVVLIFIVCTGCWPYHFTKRPGATGTVIDADNKSPIFGASVTLDSLGFRRETYKTSTNTKADGRFLIKPEQFWAIYIVPGDPALLTSVVTITASGYTDIIKDIRVTTMGSPMTNLGVIEMHHQK